MESLPAMEAAPGHAPPWCTQLRSARAASLLTMKPTSFRSRRQRTRFSHFCGHTGRQPGTRVAVHQWQLGALLGERSASAFGLHVLPLRVRLLGSASGCAASESAPSGERVHLGGWVDGCVQLGVRALDAQQVAVGASILQRLILLPRQLAHCRPRQAGRGAETSRNSNSHSPSAWLACWPYHRYNLLHPTPALADSCATNFPLLPTC